MNRLAISSLTLFSILVSSSVGGQGTITSTPEEVGFSSDRLERIDDFVQRHLDAHHFAGAVTLVARRGNVVQFEAYGMQDIEAGIPMARDSIFRIYSMSKPITSVAAMMLFEEGRFLLDDPISRYLPEFKDIGVGVEEIDRSTGEKVLKTVPAKREPTIRDLLRHTSGLTYGLWGDSLVDKMYLDKKILTMRDETLQDMVDLLSTIPLKHQPGTVWEYGLSTDLLGRLVEIVSGQAFDEFVDEQLFSPLGMTDTGFYVPPDHARRLASVYTANETNTAITPYDPSTVRDYTPRDFTERTTFISGGGGLVSTAADYLRFCQMLLNGGELDGTRILGKETVELMTRDHLVNVFDRRDIGWDSFGLGFGVALDRGLSGSVLSDGSFGWGGMAHTGFWVDPEEQLIGIFLTQLLPDSPLPYRSLFVPVVYQAIVD